MLQSKYTQGSLTPGIKHATWGNNASAGSRSLLDPVGAAGKAPLPLGAAQLGAPPPLLSLQLTRTWSPCIFSE